MGYVPSIMWLLRRVVVLNLNAGAQNMRRYLSLAIICHLTVRSARPFCGGRKVTRPAGPFISRAAVRHHLQQKVSGDLVPAKKRKACHKDRPLCGRTYASGNLAEMEIGESGSQTTGGACCLPPLLHASTKSCPHISAHQNLPPGVWAENNSQHLFPAQ